jgi:hypothetical protein
MGSSEGRILIAHELSHVVQQDLKLNQSQLSHTLLPPEILWERPIGQSGMLVYMQAESSPASAKQVRNDVAIIVGRPSLTLEKYETLEEKDQMTNWRSAANALAPHVYEGLTVDKAFVELKKLKVPIGKLYIIGHADPAGIGEVDSRGRSVSTTVEKLTTRMKTATGNLGGAAPESVEILACFGGSSPKTMARIGAALGAPKIHAPVQTTIISGTIISIKSGGKTRRLDRKKITKLSRETLVEYIKKTDALQKYDFVPGVPHPQPAPSTEDKLNALDGVLRKTGMIPYVSYNDEPGERDAVPYWKANIEERKATEEEIQPYESLGMKGVIEVTVDDKKEAP